MKGRIRKLTFLPILIIALAVVASAQTFTRELPLSEGGSISVINLSGRVDVIAKAGAAS
nr:hypothetical protein [Blastocatellia bacterium]